MDSALRASSDIDFVSEFASAADWFARHVTRTHMRAPVPTCPEWSVLDLVSHLGNVHSWAANVVETGLESAHLSDRPASHRARRVAEWYLGKAEDLYAVLRAVEPAQPCWNFAFGSGSAAFWQRRQTHETVMHGIDLAMAGDHQERVPVHLAADGIDEALTVFLTRMHNRGHPARLEQPIEVRAVDVARSWVVEPAPRAVIPSQAGPPASGTPGERRTPRVSQGGRDGIDRVEAPAVTLLKILWKRVKPTRPDVHLVGDEDRILSFLGSRLTA